MTIEQKLAHSEKMRDLQAEYIQRLEEKLESTLSRAIQAENKLSKEKLKKDAIVRVLLDVECWLNGMVGVMNNEFSKHNKSMPIGNFEHAFKQNADALCGLIKSIKE